jgi:serine/threonine-protein kinase
MRDMIAPRPLAPGTRFGPYEIIREIGTGWSAVYYLAAGGVVVDVFWSLPADDAWLANRIDQAGLATILDHPNLGRLHAAGRIDGQLFLAHEYIDGASVRQLQRRAGGGAWATDAAVALALGVAGGLAYLHDSAARDGRPLHWVHRKLDASSVFVTRDGTVKLSDFALWLPRGDVRSPGMFDPRLVRSLSPELTRAMPADPRSELFALGALLYELTTGRRPFGDPDVFSTMFAVRDARFAPPSTIVAGYPSGLERIVLRALERDLDLRYQTADELARDLGALAAAESLDVSTRVLAARVTSPDG